MSVVSRIDAIRRSLGLSDQDADVVRRSAERLAPEIEDWIERFYARLLLDPTAAEMIEDEGRVQRLKRSLAAYLFEVFALPLDTAHERTRRDIGRAHVRIGMPSYLMVTAMGGLRRDVVASARQVFASDRAHAERVAEALAKVLDLELALMLEAYDRRQREVRRRRDQALFEQRVAGAIERRAQDAVDAAACYAELLDRPDDPARPLWAARLKESIRTLSLGSRSLAAPAGSAAPTSVRVLDVCRRALDHVSLSGHMTVHVRVDPPSLVAVVHSEPLQLAIEEMLQNAATFDPSGTTTVRAIGAEDGGLIVEVTDTGPGWTEGIRTIEDAVGSTSGLGLAYCEYVADLHGGTAELLRPATGGAGVRLRLGPPRPMEPSRHAHLAAGSRRSAP